MSRLDQDVWLVIHDYGYEGYDPFEAELWGDEEGARTRAAELEKEKDPYDDSGWVVVPMRGGVATDMSEWIR